MEEKLIERGKQLHTAIVYTTMAHKGQVRKGTAIDYISHPMEVLQILAAMNAPVEVQIAGILHDVLEDTTATETELRQLFGDTVTNLVTHHSEDKSRSWRERKETNLAQTHRGTKELKMIVLADRLSNVRSMAADYEEIGEKLWERFRVGKEHQGCI